MIVILFIVEWTVIIYNNLRFEFLTFKTYHNKFYLMFYTILCKHIDSETSVIVAICITLLSNTDVNANQLATFDYRAHITTC